MQDDRWNKLLSDIKGEDISAMVEACECLGHEADKGDVAKLLQLLLDDDFVVREAAAWALTNVGRADLIPQLLTAYQRGLEEGHDNDGFTAALIELVTHNPNQSRRTLSELKQSADPALGRHADWLLKFC